MHENERIWEEGAHPLWPLGSVTVVSGGSTSENLRRAPLSNFLYFHAVSGKFD